MPKQDKQILHVRAGQKVEFPVSAEHPLAHFQTFTPVRSADDAGKRNWECSVLSRTTFASSEAPLSH
jgi:hypothetical protein